MIIGLILIALAVGLFFIARWSKGISTRSATTSASTASTSTATTTTTKKITFNWVWVGWAILIGIVIIIGIGIHQLISEDPMSRRMRSEAEIKPQPNFTEASKSLTVDFTPNHVGEWKIGRLQPGDYIYNVSGQYHKRWDNGSSSPIDSWVGIYNEKHMPEIPHPEISERFDGKGYGLIFLRMGKQYVFPGDEFSIEKESDVFAEPNIVRKNINGNYENVGSVTITIEPVEKKPDAC